MKIFHNVTIGIPAYNEERNIGNILSAIEQQSSSGFAISQVIISDDSSDDTPLLAEKFARNSRLNIETIHHNRRRGAAAAWNEIFDSAAGDIIVLYDADTIPHPKCTEQLVSSIDGGMALCASNPQPVRARRIADRAAQFFSTWLRAVRKARLSQYTVMGRALAIDSNVAKNIHLPENIIAIDLYLQCKVLEGGLNLAYNDDAVVYFQPACTMAETASQVIRSLVGHRQLQEYISRLELSLPVGVDLKQTARTIIADPLGALSAGLCFSLIPYYRSKLTATDSAMWHVAESTKTIDYLTLKSSLLNYVEGS